MHGRVQQLNAIAPIPRWVIVPPSSLYQQLPVAPLVANVNAILFVHARGERGHIVGEFGIGNIASHGCSIADGASR